MNKETLYMARWAEIGEQSKHSGVANDRSLVAVFTTDDKETPIYFYNRDFFRQNFEPSPGISCTLSHILTPHQEKDQRIHSPARDTLPQNTPV